MKTPDFQVIYRDGGAGGGGGEAGGFRRPNFKQKIKLRSKTSLILRLIHVYVFDISSRMLKVAFPSFKISKFSSGEFPQNPLQVSVSGACLLATPPPPPSNTKYAPPSLNIGEKPKLAPSEIYNATIKTKLF